MLRRLVFLLGFPLLLSAATACGTTKSRLATEQLLMSDAVDHAISEIDFRSLAGEKVFFDTRYLVNVKGVGFVNAEYIISSLRQQMIAADLRLQEKLDDSDYVVEARVGTLGTDGNEIVYGIPANRGLSEAASMLPNVPAVPAIPEISLARKESTIGAMKVAAFAYQRKSGEPIWQSGVARARTTAQDVWLFGAGPFQQGTIHGKTRFAGNDIRLPGSRPAEHLVGGPPVPFDQEFHFRGGRDGDARSIQTVQHQEPEAKSAEPNALVPPQSADHPLPAANPSSPSPPSSPPPPVGLPPRELAPESGGPLLPIPLPPGNQPLPPPGK